MKEMTKELSIELFQEKVGESFEIHFRDDHLIKVKLTAVKKLGEPGKTGYRFPFSLSFHTGLKEFYFEQATFKISHPELGSIDMFLVPIGTDDSGMIYEAIFN